MKKTITLSLFLIVALAFIARSNKDVISRKTSTQDSFKNESLNSTKAKELASHTTTKENMALSSPLSEIQKLSNKVLKKPQDLKKIESLLNEKSIQEQILTNLNDIKFYSEDHFEQRMMVLDSIYEGLKSTTPQTQEKYLALTKNLFNSSLDLISEVENSNLPIVAKNKIIQEIKGDKVEILMVLRSISPTTYKNFTTDLHEENSNHRSYTQKASAMEKIYEVSI